MHEMRMKASAPSSSGQPSSSFRSSSDPPACFSATKSENPVKKKRPPPRPHRPRFGSHPTPPKASLRLNIEQTSALEGVASKPRRAPPPNRKGRSVSVGSNDGVLSPITSPSPFSPSSPFVQSPAGTNQNFLSELRSKLKKG